MRVFLSHAEIAEACATFAARRARKNGDAFGARWAVQLQYASHNGDELVASITFSPAGSGAGDETTPPAPAEVAPL